jgi:hypothetical protein
MKQADQCENTEDCLVYCAKPTSYFLSRKNRMKLEFFLLQHRDCCAISSLSLLITPLH